MAHALNILASSALVAAAMLMTALNLGSIGWWVFGKWSARITKDRAQKGLD